MKAVSLWRTSRPLASAAFSTSELSHKKEHMNKLFDPRFYEQDFVPMNDGWVRSPFYDLARHDNLTSEGAKDLFEAMQRKQELFEPINWMLNAPVKSQEQLSFDRYADNNAKTEED